MSLEKCVAFNAMVDLMKIGMAKKSCVGGIYQAMNDGLVTTTLAFHRDLVSVEEEFSRLLAICRRTAGDENTKKVMVALGEV
jgi:hypothetical protein